MLALVTAARLGFASRWGLLADEAYHRAWALRPWVLGVYDQPPLVAWVLGLARALGGDAPLALRAAPIGLWTLAVAALTPHARDPATWWWWSLGIPPLAWLTGLAVPDGLLLPLWALAMAGAIHGGRGWWLAGVFGGLASLAKYSGIAVVPLLILAADPDERRTVHPWLGLGAALGLLAPNLAWNAAHGWVTFRFEAGEGLWSPHAPGWVGVPQQLLDQVLVLGPVGALAVAVWFGASIRRSARGQADRVDRMCLATSLPIALGFAVAAIGGPPEAHWPAPAWIGAGLGLARAGGRIGRVGALGAVFGAVVSVALALHVETPVVRIPRDPATRFGEGEVLGDSVARWVAPAATDGDAAALPVFTERYQEAALISVYAGVDARTLPGCGRKSQYDLVDPDPPLPASAWFVRPARSGPPRCLTDTYAAIEGPHVLGGYDAAGRPVGTWDLFLATEPR